MPFAWGAPVTPYGGLVKPLIEHSCVYRTIARPGRQKNVTEDRKNSARGTLKEGETAQGSA
jgi:hypothetical protein